LILGNTPPELADKSYLAAKGVRVALQGHQQFAAAVQAIHDTLKALRDGAKPAELKGIASADLMRRLTRADEYATWSRDWLGG
jgi:carboxyvinyl-carboxyphosphonate phosphorylmutase